MLEIFNNGITDEELDFLRYEFDTMKSKVDFPFKTYINKNGSIYFEANKIVVGENTFSEEGKFLNWERIKLSDELSNKIKNILLRNMPDLDDTLVFYFVRSYYPLRIHYDDNDLRQKGNTMIIPLTFDENIKTVVWKPYDNINDLEDYKRQFSNNPKIFVPTKSVPNEIDLSHCYTGTNKNFVYALEYDGAASWKKGTVLSFGRMQFHASSNFKSTREFKDFVLIHSDKIN
jgi:hypothetical protein